ncbi:MAG TPA: TonB-dependent siderophore receptor [Terriglobales bacterium]|nr:TonB-dependent siderophore receptor [Terriglobales bacterium]
MQLSCKSFRRVAPVVFGVCLTATAAMAQSVCGRVVDSSHAAIQGAQVTASGGAAKWTAVTDAAGEFRAPAAPGRTTLRISAAGFETRSWVLEGNGPPDAEVREFVLRVARVSETVTVTEPAGEQIATITSATKTPTALVDVPQSVTVVGRKQLGEQMMLSMADVVRYVPGVTAVQGENNRDQLVIRGQSTSADFFVDGVRDDVQYYRDVYNVERVEALKGPNAMVFGRGGGGGVINRVMKEADAAPVREFTLLGGAFGDRRFATDLDQPISERLAVRLNGMYEIADSFRRFVGLERYGTNPTARLKVTKNTTVTSGYEYFHDGRVADRGIPSFHGLPVDVPASLYFGDPDQSRVRARVHLGSLRVEHVARSFVVRNRFLIGDYDRGYQNFVPGAVTPDGTRAALSAYNNATKRRNLFNQTDVTRLASSGKAKHTLLGGVELGRQLTDNFRNTGFFGNTATSILAPVSNPAISTPVTFRQSSTDANNHVTTVVGAVYGQDQVEVTRWLQLLGGVRFDYFDLNFHDNRTGTELQRVDRLVSPRAGVVLKPMAALSVYGSYSVSYLPSSGDQFSSLTVITQQVKPERFTNYEVGAKWNLLRDLAVTTAVYRLDRTNTRASDPNDPTRILQTGSTRSNGFEAGVSGSVTRRWGIAGGYAYQDVFITGATTSAAVGAQVAQTPHHTFSLWNTYRIMPRLGAGLGIVQRSDMFAAADNTVRLPGYVRADAALYVTLTERIRMQANVENLFDRRYYLNADNNNNISPGPTRAVRVGLAARF